MPLKRYSGILAHPTSFPSPYGIGDLGCGARRFLDFMAEAKQKYWQILPLCPTSFGDSPYQGFSTFAGNPLLISLDILRDDGLLSQEDLNDQINDLSDEERQGRLVDFGLVINRKNRAYKRAFKAFSALPAKEKAAYNAFVKANHEWLEDYCLFVALKNHFLITRAAGIDHPEIAAERAEFAENVGGKLTEQLIDDHFYGASWLSWPKALRNHDKTAVKAFSAELIDEINYRKFLQYTFFKQWDAVYAYAKERGIEIIGDVPIFIALDSSDVWRDRALFELDENGWPIEVAGCPPDYFTETGQLWGNPLYDWEKNKEQGYIWWANRMKAALKTVDIIRLDHFRGFEAFWATKFGEPTAKDGRWRKGPGADFFKAMKAAIGSLPIIAEDLGEITDKVYKLRDQFGMPGMKIIQFGFGEEGIGGGIAAPHNFETAHCVAYTGTHDNDTAAGWYGAVSDKERDYFRRYMNSSGEDAAWDMVRLTFLSVAYLAVVPIQDVMRLDNSARMNYPGIQSGNWRFRYTDDMLTGEQAAFLSYISRLTDRNIELIETTDEKEARIRREQEAKKKAGN